MTPSERALATMPIASDRALRGVAVALFFAAVALHGWARWMMGELGSWIFDLWALVPYGLCLIVLFFSKSAVPALAGLIVALLADLAGCYKAFVSPAPGDDLVLMYVPFLTTLVLLPVTILIARAMSRPGESASQRLFRGAKRTLAIIAFIVCSFAAYFAYWDYQYKRADSASNAFCESAGIGSDLSAATARAEASGIRHGRLGDESHAFMFPGPIHNLFVCELTVADGKVISRQAKHD